MPFKKVCQKTYNNRNLGKINRAGMPGKHHERDEILRKAGVFAILRLFFGSNAPQTSHDAMFFSAKNRYLNHFFHRNFKKTHFSTKFSLHANVSNGLRATFSPHATPKQTVNDDDALQPNHLYNGIKVIPSCHPLFLVSNILRNSNPSCPLSLP